MKTPITEIERRELQEKIENATGGAFTHPMPEFFISADKNSAGMQAAVMVANPGHQHESRRLHVVVVNKNPEWLPTILILREFWLN